MNNTITMLKNKKDPLDRAIDYMLKFQRTDANFEIPKLLAVVDSIQKYVLANQNEVRGL